MHFLNGELKREEVAELRSLPVTQFIGVEVYPLASDLVPAYRMGSTGCGAIGLWTKDALR
jgi:hypothetical protein